MFSAEGTFIVCEGRKLTLLEAVRLQTELSTAIRAVLEEKVRKSSGLLVTPEDAAWEATVSEVDL